MTTRLLTLTLSLLLAPAVQAALVPRATCLQQCAAEIIAQCTKVRPNGTTRIKPLCRQHLIRRCRHHKVTCATTTSTTVTTTTATSTTSTTCPVGQMCTQPPPVTGRLVLTVPDHGSDLDTGFSGISQNFPIIHGSSLVYDLACPDGANCTGTATTGAGTPNGETFGAPLPLLAGGIPVCVVNRFQNPTLTGTFNLTTGAAGVPTPNDVALFSDTYITSFTAVCPKCIGATGLGTTGKCDGSSKHPNATCTVNGEVTVAGHGLYLLSSDCTPGPAASFTATLNILLPLTTGQAPVLTDAPGANGPCKNQTQDDGCQGGACTAGCTGSACVSHDADGNCIDAKGGISQICCNGAFTSTPCFPTSAASGSVGIVRTGKPVIPGDAAGGVFAGTFCIDATTSNVINITSGLPGPGALLLPSVATFTPTP